MKLLVNILFFSGIALFSLNSYGQEVKNDPTYSVNNYKHPNKAKAAKEAGKDQQTALKPTEAEVNNNYKAQNRATRKEKRKAHSIENGGGERKNYKQQFAPSERK